MPKWGLIYGPMRATAEGIRADLEKFHSECRSSRAVVALW